MYFSRISSKGQVVIPKEIRDRLGIKAGSRVGFSLAGEQISIYPLSEDPVGQYKGVFGRGSSLTQALLRERKEERKREERQAAGQLRDSGLSKRRK